MNQRSTGAIWAKLITIPNLFLFFISALLFGGEALSGKVEDGKYFLRSIDKHFVEVSSGLWHYSYFQGLSMAFGALTVLGLSLVLKFSKKE